MLKVLNGKSERRASSQRIRGDKARNILMRKELNVMVWREEEEEGGGCMVVDRPHIDEELSGSLSHQNRNSNKDCKYIQDTFM